MIHNSPDISVVIASHNAAAVIGRCLGALQQQSPRLQIIVADCSGDGTREVITERFPQVQLLHFSEPLGLAELRGHAIALAEAALIAVIDPYSIVAPDWAVALLRVHAERPNLVIGGAVELYRAETQSIWRWASYINEYGLFMQPLTNGEVGLLPGSNISYKRRALFDGGRSRYPVFWKTFVNAELAYGEAPLWQTSAVTVALDKPIAFREFLRSRFDHGRCYAAMRIAPSRSGYGERALRALTAPLLPGLLLWRWGRRYWGKRRYRQKLMLSLPLQLLLFGNWALGELTGYICGAGGSCRRLHY